MSRRSVAPSVTVIEGCAIATVDDDAARARRRPHRLRGRPDRRGRRRARRRASSSRTSRIDGRGKLATPGLVNCHHHLYQWATRGYAQQATLFEWLVALYPVWAHIDARDRRRRGARRARRARPLGLHDVDRPPLHLPRAAPATCSRSRSRPRARSACASTRAAARWTSAAAPAACRPTTSSRTATRSSPPAPTAIDRFHDPAPGAMVRIALAPTSPFSVTGELMARDRGARPRARRAAAHAPRRDRRRGGASASSASACGRSSTSTSLGWLGDDVWLAHCVHLDAAEAARMGATGTGVAHCPTSNGRLGAGIAPVPRAAARRARRSGLGVDGAASNECGELVDELRAALVLARVAGGPAALTAREALELATRHGARCLGPRGRARPPQRRRARRRRAVGPRRARLRRHRRPGRRARVRPDAARRTRCSSAASAVVAGGELRTADPVDARRRPARARAPGCA